MDVMAALAARRAVKKFDPEHKMPEAEIRALVDAAVLSPTAFNIQNWRFVLVTDQAQKDALRAVAWNQAQFSDCSLLVIVCGDLQAHTREPERFWRHPPDAAKAIVPMITSYYEGNERAQHDEVLRSGSMAAQSIMLAAQELGYESCPMSGFDFAKVAQLIELPDDHEIVMAVAIGRGLEPARERSGPIPLSEVVARDRFPTGEYEDR
ncbi:nitroreductase family protein [bacterium]|nr:nitroreductase family protein [bacterium]